MSVGIKTSKVTMKLGSTGNLLTESGHDFRSWKFSKIILPLCAKTTDEVTVKEISTNSHDNPTNTSVNVKVNLLSDGELLEDIFAIYIEGGGSYRVSTSMTGHVESITIDFELETIPCQ